MIRNPHLFTSLVLTVLVIGCGPSRPQTVYVDGVVSLDGEPVEGAAVLFSPEEGRPASGTTNAQGEFVLQTFKARDGAVLGTHNVTVTLKRVTGVGADPDGLSGEIAPGGMQVEWVVPKKYSSPDTSGLRIDVTSSIELPVRLNLISEET